MKQGLHFYFMGPLKSQYLV